MKMPCPFWPFWGCCSEEWRWGGELQPVADLGRSKRTPTSNQLLWHQNRAFSLINGAIPRVGRLSALTLEHLSFLVAQVIDYLWFVAASKRPPKKEPTLRHTAAVPPDDTTRLPLGPTIACTDRYFR
jgi:hypothetical protein